MPQAGITGYKINTVIMCGLTVLYYITSFTKFWNWMFTICIPFYIFINTHTHTPRNFIFDLQVIFILLNLICAFSGIFYCQVWKDITVVFSVFIIRLFWVNHKCSPFLSVNFCVRENFHILLLPEYLCPLQIKLLIPEHLLEVYV